MSSTEFSSVNFEVLFAPEHPPVEIVNFSPKTLFVYVETENGTFKNCFPSVAFPQPPFLYKQEMQVFLCICSQ